MTFLRTLVRRWKVTVPGVALTLLLVAGAFATVKPQYRAEGTLVLLGPKTQPNAEQPGGPPLARNPLLDLGGLSVVTEVMTQRMTDEAVVRRLVGEGASPEFEVQQNLETRSPLLVVIADAKTPAKAERTLDVVFQGIADELLEIQRQDGAVGADQLIRASTLRKDAQASARQGSRTRAVAAAMVIGVLLTLAAVFGLEGIARARAARAEEPQDDAGASDVVGSGATPVEPVHVAGRVQVARAVERPPSVLRQK